MKTKIKYSIVFSLGLLLICFSSCTREELEAPSPFGPAGFAILVEMSANPNVLLAGNIRQTSIVTIKVTTSEGEPLANRTLYCSITNELGNTIDTGYFKGYKTMITCITNQEGVVNLTYYAPRGDEITRNKTVYIWATLVHFGTEFIQTCTPITIIKAE